MKYQQIIEKVEFSFASPYAQEHVVKVHKNPSSVEMQAAKTKSSSNELRGWLIGNAVYIWDANLALHSDVLDYLQLPPGIKPKSFILDDDMNLMPADYNTSEEEIWSAPMIKRMMK